VRPLFGREMRSEEVSDDKVQFLGFVLGVSELLRVQVCSI
jgi:hypothetical protein